METNLNKTIADRIFEKIPSNIKPVEYLMGLLGLSRESVYRRKKGELSFSFDEIVKLSDELNFSIDELIGRKERERMLFSIQNYAQFNPEETFLTMFKEYLTLVKKQHETPEVSTVITQNRVLPVFALKFKNLLKFLYYKWMHQGYRVPLNFYYADVVVPYEILALKDELLMYINRISNYTFIIDWQTYTSTFNEILYYYERKLITKEELFILKDDMLNLLKHTESLAQRGINDFGAVYRFYLSSLNVESNTFYVKYDGKVESLLWLYYVNPVATTNERMCASHKRWIDSMINYSTLITHDNKTLLTRFYDTQYQYIEDKTKVIFG